METKIQYTEDKIKELYKEFSSCSIEDNLTPEEITILMEKNCECDNCSDPIFKADDFPNISIKHNHIECSECERSRSDDIQDCILCENRLYYEDLEDYLEGTRENQTTEEYLKDFFIYISEPGYQKGIYKVLDLPFYIGDCVTGFDNFFPDAIKFIKDIENENYSGTGKICKECAVKHLKTESSL